MSSIIKVNTYQDANGNALFSSDGSGNVTLSSADLKNTPAFEAYLTADQSIANNTLTRCNYNAVRFDTNSVYNTSTYRFTVPSAGKYFIYAGFMFDGATNGTTTNIYLHKNGSQYLRNGNVGYNGYKDMVLHTTINCSASDYFEIYGYHNSGSTQNFESDASNNAYNVFGAYKLIGA